MQVKGQESRIPSVMTSGRSGCKGQGCHFDAEVHSVETHGTSLWPWGRKSLES